MKRYIVFPCLVGILSLVPAPLFAQGKVGVTSLAPAGGNLTLTVQNTDSFPFTGLSTGFRLEASPTLAPGTWLPVNASFAPIAGRPGFYSTTFARPAGTKYFYRAIGTLGTADDLDGDGLSETFEATIGTNSALFDSDFDGFSDGQEFAYSTDPRNAGSQPAFAPSVPNASFFLADSVATEGGGTHQVQILFDRTYNGIVNYVINSLSNTVAGTDYAPVSGSIAMNGTTAMIPITPIDDVIVSGQRVIIVELRLNGENYFIGGRSSHVILLNDNDAWWTGALAPASGETGSQMFRVKITHQGAITSVVFGAGAGQDGLPLPVGAVGSSSISTSIIPAGSWAGTSPVDDTTQFRVESPALPITAGSIVSQPRVRRLQLNAQPALNSTVHPHSLTPGVRYIGEYTETLSSTAGVTLSTYSGTFLLMRDIPAPLPVLSSLVP